MPLSTLSDDLYIVHLAYTAAFLPWTALTTYDFISPAWRRARDVRVAGYFNLLCAALPALYILFYMVVQASVDRKEMFTALVALIFALLHLVRTLWGLWQLRIFTRWAARSVRALRALGIDYRVHGTEDDLDPEEVAEQLYVSDELIENQLFHGKARCYLKFGHVAFKTDAKKVGLFCQRALLFAQTLSMPLRFIHAVVLRCRGKGDAARLRQMPHKPEEVWLRWAVAFAAQGLADWVTEFEVASAPTQEDIVGLRHGELYVRRRDYLAGRVLATAGLQLWMGHCVPLSGDALVSKTELLSTVARSGLGLPFDAPQARVAAAPEAGYAAYRRKLERIIDAMPVSFGQEIERFDVERLEWLAILLNMGQCALAEGNTGEAPGARARAGERKGKGKREGEGMFHGDVAMENLRAQLGIGEQVSGSSVVERKVATLSAFPMPERVFHALSEGNRLVTEVGELTDCWLALVSGDQVRFLLGKDRRWGQWCLGVTSPGSDAVLSEAGRCPEGSAMFWIQVGLEEARLAYQFGVLFQEFKHVEQTFTFMGHSLELLRTMLGQWVQANGSTQKKVWNPIVFEAGKLATAWKSLGQMSRELASTLNDRGPKCVLEDRGVQSRVLWELQKAAREAVVNSKEGPVSVQAIALCLLSFPSLIFADVHKSNGRANEKKRSQEEENIEIREENGLVSMRLEWQNGEDSGSAEKGVRPVIQFVIAPQCGPQQLTLHVQLEGSIGAVLRVSLRLCRGSKIRDESFRWESWRDSAMGRMEGLRRWQSNHGIRSPDLHIPSTNITSGARKIELGLMGIGNEMLTWCGWRAFRAEHCKLELLSEKVLMKFDVTEDLDLESCRRGTSPRMCTAKWVRANSSHTMKQTENRYVMDVLLFEKRFKQPHREPRKLSVFH